MNNTHMHTHTHTHTQVLQHTLITSTRFYLQLLAVHEHIPKVVYHLQLLSVKAMVANSKTKPAYLTEVRFCIIILPWIPVVSDS